MSPSLSPSRWLASYSSKLGKLKYRPAQGRWRSSKPSGWLTGDEESSGCRSTLSNMAVRVDSGEVDLRTESGGDPETKARVNSSVARRLDWFARAFRLAQEVVMEGSVAEARSNLGRLLLALRSAESLRCISGASEAIMIVLLRCLVDTVLMVNSND